MSNSYSKSDLEKIVLTQLDNLNTQGEQIRLIKEQNELLVKYNHKLMTELSNQAGKSKPYTKTKRKTG